METTGQADPYGRGSYCIVVALHGTDSREAETLRWFRDEVLHSLPGGERLVDAYYRACPLVTARLSGNSHASAAIAASISGISRAIAPFSSH